MTNHIILFIALSMMVYVYVYAPKNAPLEIETTVNQQQL